MKHSLLSVWLLALALILAACGAVEPQPGATLVGSIAMDTAKSAQITLTVSGDGRAIEK